MGSVIVIEFVSLDGVIEDPGQPWEGWAFRHGPEAVTGDKFRLGEVWDTGVLLLGRTTWQEFSQIFAAGDDEFSQKMNAIPKLVASRSLEHVDGWSNSTMLAGDLVAETSELRRTRDVVVAGSASVVDELKKHDLVDQYRLTVFPSVCGKGRKLFDNSQPIDLKLVSADRAGQAIRLVYDRHTIKH